MDVKKKELDATLVRTLCAGIAARENIQLKPKPVTKNIIKMVSKDARTDGISSLEDILLNDMGVKERNKLMKRIPPILKELKTNDVDTARSFLGLERYSDVRRRIVVQLNEFVTSDLKMEILTS